MHFLDWLLVASSLLIVAAVGCRAQRYMNSLADSLASKRVARRYLLAVSRAEMGSGAVVFTMGFAGFYGRVMDHQNLDEGVRSDAASPVSNEPETAAGKGHDPRPAAAFEEPATKP